jgi:hypothetical protein
MSGPGAPVERHQAADLHPLGWMSEHGTVGAADDAEDGNGAGRAASGPGQTEDAAGDLPFERRWVEVALAGDDEIGTLEAGGEANEVGHEVEPRE